MELARLFADYWTSFAKDGKPSAPAGTGPAWPAFNAAADELLVLDLQTRHTARDKANAARCDFWAAFDPLE
jgi:carboxylesterase type B